MNNIQCSNKYLSTGYTLIEMVVVIVLIGVLALTAAPKFMNSQADARIAVLKGFEAAFYAANEIVMAKAEVAGILDGTGKEKNIPGTDLYVRDNYISVKPTHLHSAMSIDGLTVSEYDDWTFIYFGEERDGERFKADQCYIQLMQYQDSETETDGLKIFRKFGGC